MYSVSVRDHIMIAHSFVGAIFGPAQALHGATFVVDAEFRRRQLSPEGLVVDIGAASVLLKQVLTPLNYQNLDEMPEYRGRNTTTEYLAGDIYRKIAAGIRAGALGADGPALDSLRIVLSESHVASGSYEAPLNGDAPQ